MITGRALHAAFLEPFRRVTRPAHRENKIESMNLARLLNQYHIYVVLGMDFMRKIGADSLRCHKYKPI
jgi:hypothetical protein